MPAIAPVKSLDTDGHKQYGSGRMRSSTVVAAIMPVFPAINGTYRRYRGITAYSSVFTLPHFLFSLSALCDTRLLSFRLCNVVI